MAQVPYQGVPEVAAETQAANDYQHIEATPGAFGAPVAEGLQSAGQGVIDASKFYGTVAADQATNNYLQESTNLLHGEPGKTVVGPDGQMVPDTGFFGLRGQNAMAARQATAERLDEIQQEQLENLHDPLSRLRFEDESRRYRAQYDVQMATHADAEQRVWATDVNNTAYQQAIASAARQADNPIAAGVAMDRAQAAAKKNAQLAGIPAEGAILKATQDVTLARVRSLIVSNPQAAKDVFDKFGDVLAGRPDYDQVSRQVKDAVTNSVFAPNLDKDVNDALASVQPRVGSITEGKPVAADIYSAIGGEEWRGTGPAPTSAKGAVGPSQIMPATAVQYGLATNEVEAKEKLKDPAFAQHAKQMIIDKISALPDVQGDPARIAVGYFSGAGNIAPPGSPTPYKADTNDGHENVSTYVSNVLQRLQKYPSTADALAAARPQLMDQERARAAQLFPNQSDVQERYVNNFERRIDQEISQQHQSYEIAAHTVQAVFAGPHPPISEEQLMAVSPQVAEAAQTVKFNAPYLWAGIENRFNAEAKGRALGYGTGFKDYLDRALAPANDGSRIQNPMELNNFIGQGEDAALTNTGADQLTSLLALRGTSAGEAFATRVRTFMDDMHAELTFSNPSVGRIDSKGEERYGRFAIQALPILENAQKNGTLDQVLNPKSPDYLGGVAAHFMRTPAQMMKDRAMDQTLTRGLDEGSVGRYLLRDAVTRGRLTVPQATQIGEALGYFRAGGASSKKAPNPLANITIQPQGYSGGMGPPGQ